MIMRIERDRGSWELRHKAETDFHHRFTEIHFHRLPEQDSHSLVNHLLGGAELPAEIQEIVMARTEGNPFYLEEVVRHMIEQVMIIEDEGGWKTTEALREIGIPDTLQGVLLARIDRLEEDVRNTLQMASVIGKSFLYSILEAMSEAKRELDSHLSQLQRVDLVREKSRIPELEYIFRQTLTQEAAYKSLLHERRKEFHLKVGEALEILFADRIQELLGLLAYHFEAAEVFEKAVEYLQQAGDQARLAHAHREAIDFYQRALLILKEQKIHDLAARTLMKIALTYHSAFDFQRSQEAYDEAFAMRHQDWEKRPPILEPAPKPLRLIQQIEPRSLDPTFIDQRRTHTVVQNIFSPLVVYGAGWEIFPEVALRWEISEDGRKYIFYIRDDVFWSDGVKVTADDFAFSMIRTLNPATGTDDASHFFSIENARAFNQGELYDPAELGIRAIDDQTLELSLEQPASYFLHAMTLLFPIPKHKVEEQGDLWVDVENIVSNGAFQLFSYKPGEVIRFVKNPTYHGNFPGNLEMVELLLSTQISTEWLELYKENRIDILRLLPPILDFRHHFAEEYTSYPLTAVYIIAFNNILPPFDDHRVRSALVRAVDREKLANEVLDGLSSPGTGGLVPPNIPGHSPGIGLRYDPTQARELLAQAGYPNGQNFPSFELCWVRPSSLHEYLRSQWKEVLNLDVKITMLDWEKIFKGRSSRSMNFIGWDADYPDPDVYLRTFVRKHALHWQNQEYDRLLEQAQQSINQKDRIRFYKQADKILIEDAVIMPLTYPRSHRLFKPWVKIPAEVLQLRHWKNIIIEPQ
jgi:oligopeptide transport system substrate-binding protein